MLLINQHANVGPQVLFTAPIRDLYLVSIYQSNQLALASGALTTTIFWTDITGTKSAIPAPFIRFNNVNNFSTGSAFIEIEAGSTISFEAVVAGASGTPTYTLAISVVRVGVL